MQYIMSMVHHNPGEAPFNSKFNSPETLFDYGFNSQVFKHINTVVTFDSLVYELFPENSPEKLWLENNRKNIANEINKAKALNLKVYYHIDLFVLPKKLVNIFSGEICDEEGKISIDKPMTLNLHRIMLDELFADFPGVDGLIIRVGETYLQDTPYHIGNGAIKYGDKAREKAQFVKLLNFLRDEVCVKHNKELFFRTWDCFSDRFHANKEYYLEITNQIDPHPNLFFSIKYVALDFWRHVQMNDCLTAGKHAQIIEVQCQREYEGKGAFPSYIMNDVINSDAFLVNPFGIKNIINKALIKGLYIWPRGGGWYGPYINDEFWCDLNTYVISHYANDIGLKEENIFYNFVMDRMGLSNEDSIKFRKMCLLSSDAIVKSRYISEYDKTLNEKNMPCCNWMRDDCIGGLYQLEPAFEFLYANNLFEDVLAEKYNGLENWNEINRLSKEIDWSNCSHGEFIKFSAEYAYRLFKALYLAWSAMIKYYKGKKKNIFEKDELIILVNQFEDAWQEYLCLNIHNDYATLYGLKYLENEPGLIDTIEIIKNACID